MNRSSALSFRRVPARWLSLVVCALLPAAACGQEFLMRVEPAKKAVPLNVISLRPNAPTTVSFFLKKNPDAVETEVVTAEVVQIVQDRTRVLARGKAIGKPDDEEIRFEFAKVPKDPKDSKDAKLAKEDPDKLDLGEGPFQLFLRVARPKAAKGEDPYLTRPLKLRVREPRDFVDVTIAEFDKDSQQLRFKVLLKDVAVGPRKCAVNLVLGPEFKSTKKGNFKVELTEVNKEYDLFAGGLEFLRGADDTEGRVYISVDGYEHAFMFMTTLKEGKLPEVTFDNKVGVDLRVPRYAVPSEKMPISLKLDGPLDAGYKVELALDRTGRKEQFPVKKVFPGLRRQRMELGFSPKGDLVWQGDIGTLQTEMDISEVFGPVWLRVRVLKDDKEIELVPAAPTAPGAAVLEADPDDKESKSLYARVILDATPPQGVEFVDLPKENEWALKKPLPLYVNVNKRADYQAPIDKVIFLKSKAPPDGKINPETILGPGVFDAKKGAWLLLLPGQEKAEALDITVLVTTAAGLPAVKTATIMFREPIPVKTAVNIKGKVLHGDVARPKLAVTLFDDKGKVKDTQKTNDKGEFVFAKVPPGSYVVAATVSFPALVGQTKVVVKEGDDKDVNGTVKLLAK